MFQHFAAGTRSGAGALEDHLIDPVEERRLLAAALDVQLSFEVALPGRAPALCLAVDTTRCTRFRDLARVQALEGPLEYRTAWYLLPQATPPCVLLSCAVDRPVRDTIDVRFSLPEFERTLRVLPAHSGLTLLPADDLAGALGAPSPRPSSALVFRSPASAPFSHSSPVGGTGRVGHAGEPNWPATDRV